MMETIQPISNAPVYNAVKIKIKHPTANITGDVENNNNYHAVDIEVDEPEINVYRLPEQYPGNYYMSKMNIPQLPATPIYQTINTNTLVNAKIQLKSPKKQIEKKEIEVPKPNFTTVEAEKLPYPSEIAEKAPISQDNAEIKNKSAEAVTFKGIQEPEIIPSKEILPDVNISDVVKKLSSKNYDEQAAELEKIATAAIESNEIALPYVTKDVFHALIKILEKDTSELEGPSEEQQEIRKKIILNRIAEEKAIQEKQDMNNFKAPFEISDTELAIASRLTPMELAERNKEYALYSIAILSKTYINEYEKQTENVVPFTDIPGISNIVETLKNNSNYGIKIAAINALSFVYRKEYKDEMNSILILAAKDTNPYVAQKAISALTEINKQNK